MYTIFKQHTNRKWWQKILIRDCVSLVYVNKHTTMFFQQQKNRTLEHLTIIRHQPLYYESNS